MTRILFALLALLQACSITETGNPPAVPTLDEGSVDGTSLFGGSVDVRGAPGAVDPPAGVVRATNLENANPTVDWPVEADGSFAGRLSAEVGDVVRLQVVGDEARGEPLDLDASTFEPVPSALPCLDVTRDLPIAGEGDVRIENGCEDAAEIEVVRLRVGAAYSFDAGAFTVEPGASHVIHVSTTTGGEDVLLLETSAPLVARFAVTLRPID